jgi:hypothetical protein
LRSLAQNGTRPQRIMLSGKQDEKSTSIRMRECRRMRDERRA